MYNGQMEGIFSGFDWERGNRQKCRKHGLSTREVEELFSHPLMIIPDAAHSQSEARLRAIGRSRSGRMVFVVFTVRKKDGERLIRPISARYMHGKEVRHYEEENPDLRDR